jgi:hypothetical protein
VVSPAQGTSRIWDFAWVGTRGTGGKLRRFNEQWKRGGGQSMISLDLELAESRLQADLATGLSPEQIFERRWAQTILDRAVQQLKEISSYFLERHICGALTRRRYKKWGLLLLCVGSGSGCG